MKKRIIVWISLIVLFCLVLFGILYWKKKKESESIQKRDSWAEAVRQYQQSVQSQDKAPKGVEGTSRETTKSRLRSIYAAMRNYRSTDGRDLSTEEGIDKLIQRAYLNRDDSKDGWGNPFIYRFIDSYKFVLKSSGPDGRVGTTDDIEINQDGTIR